MSNKLFYISIFAGLSLLLSQKILGQSVQEKLILSDSLYYDFQTGSMEPLFIEQIWKNSLGEVDSVLWKTSIQPDLSLLKKFRLQQVDTAYFLRTKIDSTTLNCSSQSDTFLYIFQYKSEDSIHIKVLKRFNHFLEKDYLVAYSLDTLSFYAGKKAPPQKVKNIAFNFNYCYNNAIVICPMTIALIPFKINVTYNDTALKNMYLVVSKNRSRTFTVNGATFRLFQNKISPVFNRYNTKFKVTEAAIIHTNKIENGIRTKSTYSMGDTIFTKASHIILDSIDEVGHLLYYTSLPVNSTSNIVSLPEKYLKDLKPFFKPNRQYMVLDFWGTWCAPCIAGIPDLKRLYNQTKAKADFLSICFDTEDKLPLAKKIFKKHSIEWATILNDQKKPTLTNFLQISSFPTYVVISKKGEVIYKNTGPEGFDNLKTLLNRL